MADRRDSHSVASVALVARQQRVSSLADTSGQALVAHWVLSEEPRRR